MRRPSYAASASLGIDGRLGYLRFGRDLPSLARMGDVPGDHRAMKLVSLRQLAYTSTTLIPGDQLLQLGEGKLPLSLPQHPHVWTSLSDASRASLRLFPTRRSSRLTTDFADLREFENSL